MRTWAALMDDDEVLSCLMRSLSLPPSLDHIALTSLQPTTMLSTGSSSLTGAETTTFLMPWSKYGCSLARVRNSPVQSSTMLMPRPWYGICEQQRAA